jgi:hypothetical protein
MIYVFTFVLVIVVAGIFKEYLDVKKVKNVVTGEFPNIELGIRTNGVQRFLAYRRNGEWYGVVGYEEFKRLSDKVDELLAEREEEKEGALHVREFIESVVLPKIMEAERTVVRKKRTPKKAKKVVKKK